MNCFDALVLELWPRQRDRLGLLLEVDGGGLSAELTEAVRHQVLGGGKRLRAVLPPAVAGGLAGEPVRAQGREADVACWLGLSLELLHSGTLAHDDLMDRDELRRDRPTVWVRFGDAQAIDTGDLLFYLAEEAVHRSMLPPAERLAALHHASTAMRRVIHGQGLEVELRRGGRLPDFESYQRLAAGKTGMLFGLGFVYGGLAAGASELHHLESLGRDMGTVFQVQDDLLDLVGSKGRGDPGGDLWEGKPSWLIAHCAAHLSESRRLRLARLLYLPREEKSAADIEAIREEIDAQGSIEEGLELLRHSAVELEERARSEAPELADLVAALIERIYAPLSHVL